MTDEFKMIISLSGLVAGGFGALLRYIWNESHRRIDKLEEEHKTIYKAIQGVSDELHERIDITKDSMNEITTQLALIKQAGDARQVMFEKQQGLLESIQKGLNDQMAELSHQVMSAMQVFNAAEQTRTKDIFYSQERHNR